MVAVFDVTIIVTSNFMCQANWIGGRGGTWGTGTNLTEARDAICAKNRYFYF